MDAGWVDLPRRVGDRIAPLIGCALGSVVCTDSTSINLYKAVVAAAQLVEGDILTDSGNFPSDLYVLGSVAGLLGRRLRIVEPEQIMESLAPGIVSLTQVDFRSGRRHDLKAITARAHEVGAVTVWDLSHSAGAMPIELALHKVEMAVGCGYKYLNGGPGSPAFITSDLISMSPTRSTDGSRTRCRSTLIRRMFRPPGAIGCDRGHPT